MTHAHALEPGLYFYVLRVQIRTQCERYHGTTLKILLHVYVHQGHIGSDCNTSGDDVDTDLALATCDAPTPYIDP